uniref:Transcription factor, DNA binding domain cpaD n=1 Tax=Curvularia pallescens TaxID=318706 RepID=A0A218PFY8_9PLEO|nr:transcription factor, DNA binding domain cpaD [Curvularia pallescens]
MSVLPPTRQSCDRCHKQKLRCKRPEKSDTDACERCLRKGAECTYSSSLPKGRPSAYRQENASPDRGYNSIEWAPIPSAGQVTVAEQPTVPCTMGATEAMGGSLPVTIPDSASPDFWTQFMQGEEVDTTIPGIIPDIDMTFDPLPPLEQTSLVSEGLPAVQSSQQQNTIKFFEDTAYIPQQQPQKQHRSRTTHQAPPPVDAKMQNSHQDDPGNAQEQGHLDHTIVHLSQLSVHLSTLLSSSRDNPLIANNGPVFCSDDSAALQQLQSNIGSLFESINIWLARGPAHLQEVKAGQNGIGQSSQSQLMSEILAASFEMTQIIQRLRLITTPDATPPPSTSNASTDTLSESSQHPYCTIRYLVAVCMTLLLNTYIGIVISLQNSADALKTYQWASEQTQSRQSTDSSICTWNTTECIKLQFVGMVQMCSSFMRRQIEVSKLLMPSRLSSSELPGGNSCWEAVEKLKIELEQRLKQLHKSLDMAD